MHGRVPLRPDPSSHAGPLLAGLLAACSSSQPPPVPPEPEPAPATTTQQPEAAATASDAGPAAVAADSGTQAQAPSITITALSRGRGVPTVTRDMFRALRQQLETEHTQTISNLSVQRIGLEGEMRLCVQFHQRDQADAVLARLKQQAGDVELLDISGAPCPPSRKSPP